MTYRFTYFLNRGFTFNSYFWLLLYGYIFHYIILLWLVVHMYIYISHIYPTHYVYIYIYTHISHCYHSSWARSGQWLSTSSAASSTFSPAPPCAMPRRTRPRRRGGRRCAWQATKWWDEMWWWPWVDGWMLGMGLFGKTYPLVMTNSLRTWSHGPVEIVDLPTKHGDFP